MALNATTIEADVKATVKAYYTTAFDAGNFSNPPTDAEIAEALAAMIAKVVPDIVSHIKTNADLTGVSSGGDTVYGGVD